ncbi:MAG: HAD family hydrolase [Gammaproteobacteria bacterium]|jgi:HAD superfamily hydrolase (TIGR01490 family)|nr:HAD family hydrolase [Gammaproteobacteria bacterium]MBT3488142.1 HAD family hydrolase [Gammaproteobacteria bacterium]MBT3719200.1 HAD family hydrolase [Gammaproteobacteria bacterium]MBT3844294.1 HAD family hydrolase [Gammaproteobacteria bacterium]MBT3894006.1 HAD family hydrolase [Gammaproteobacteria bacterium]
MALAIFDLDNTLIGGDSDHLWGEFLVRHGHVDKDFYRRENDRFYAQYVAGTLDIEEWLSFQFAPLAAQDMATLKRWHQQFMLEEIQPIMLPKAEELIESHRTKGDTLLVITATNHFITAPIVERLGIPHLIATIPEQLNGAFTGQVDGLPSYQQGKITRLEAWLKEHPLSMEGSTFYSDSHNDLPLLKQVEFAVAVDPDEILRETAQQHNWPILSLRG